MFWLENPFFIFLFNFIFVFSHLEIHSAVHFKSSDVIAVKKKCKVSFFVLITRKKRFGVTKLSYAK